MTTKEHEIFGGSSVKYWLNCFGWASRIQNLPEDLPGEAALRGTALHTGVLELKLRQELDNKLYGTVVNPDYSTIPNWPEEGEELAEEFWKYFWTEILEEFVTGKTIYIEKKLMLFSDLGSGGTADVIVIWYNDKGKLVLYNLLFL